RRRGFSAYQPSEVRPEYERSRHAAHREMERPTWAVRPLRWAADVRNSKPNAALVGGPDRQRQWRLYGRQRSDYPPSHATWRRTSTAERSSGSGSTPSEATMPAKRENSKRFRQLK